MRPITTTSYCWNKIIFYALSWMIAQLGILKDEGLKVIAIKEALQINAAITESQALKKAYLLAGKKQMNLPAILKESGNLINRYCKRR
jgi:hypothetical protein